MVDHVDGEKLQHLLKRHPACNRVTEDTILHCGNLGRCEYPLQLPASTLPTLQYR